MQLWGLLLFVRLNPTPRHGATYIWSKPSLLSYPNQESPSGILPVVCLLGESRFCQLSMLKITDPKGALLLKIAKTCPHSPVHGEGVWETEARRWLAFPSSVVGSQDWHLHLDSWSLRGRRRLAALICFLSSPADSSLGGWVLQGGAGPTASGCLGARSFLVAKTSADRAGGSGVGLSRPL